jgi:hypothetical protein
MAISSLWDLWEGGEGGCATALHYSALLASGTINKLQCQLPSMSINAQSSLVNALLESARPCLRDGPDAERQRLDGFKDPARLFGGSQGPKPQGPRGQDSQGWLRRKPHHAQFIADYTQTSVDSLLAKRLHQHTNQIMIMKADC